MMLLWTPLPIVIAFIFYCIFTWPPLSKRRWARIGRFVCAFVAIVTMLYWMNGIYNKVTVHKGKGDAQMTTRFKNHVEDLIKDGHLDDARNLLSQFNERYPAIARDDEEIMQYMDQLNQKGK